MKRNYFIVVLLIGMLFMASHIYAADQPLAMSSGDYVIGPGDVLDISVWENAALTKAVTVLPDGKIHFPLIGEIIAGGKTLVELEKELGKAIAGFVPNPNLSVIVQQVNSMQIYVIGKVNKPGRFELNTSINVLQALALAGGVNAFAKRDKIKIFRKIDAKTRIFTFDYDDVTDGEHLEQNRQLERGDVVVVP